MNRKEMMHQGIMTYRKVDIMMRRYLDRKLSPTGVFATQHRLLMELGRNNNCSQVELAEKFEVSAAAIAVSLKKLEKGGYITRLADQTDNRMNQVSITEKGRDVIHRSIQVFQATDRLFFDGFTDEEVEEFCRYLERIYHSFSSANTGLDIEGQEDL